MKRLTTYAATIGILALPSMVSSQLSLDEAWRQLQEESQLQQRPRPQLHQLPGAEGALRAPLRRKPGYIVGRIVDMYGYPIETGGVVLHIEGIPADPSRRGPVLWSGEITPSVNPQNGYYEVHIEPGEWRVGGQASPQLRAAFPSTTECLMMLEDFLPPNTESYAQIPYQDSRRGIIQDLVWNPTPWFAWKCAKASRAARGLQ